MTATASHFTVRLLQPADSTGYMAITRQVDALHHQALPDRIKPPEAVKRSEESYLAMLDQPNTWLFGIDHEGALIGMIKMQLVDRPERIAHRPIRVMIIDELAVDQRWRRHGIGRLLMDHAIDWARSRDAQSVDLRVYEFNAGAIAFYESMGMRTLTRVLSLSL